MNFLLEDLFFIFFSSRDLLVFIVNQKNLLIFNTLFLRKYLIKRFLINEECEINMTSVIIENNFSIIRHRKKCNKII